jgi:hypothetical protein
LPNTVNNYFDLYSATPFLAKLSDRLRRDGRIRRLEDLFSGGKKALDSQYPILYCLVQDSWKEFIVVHNFSDSLAYYYRYYFDSTGLSGVR